VEAALTIGANRYDGVLELVDILPSRAVVGAFKHDQTLSDAGRPYQTQFERSDSDIILLTVARDASVSIRDEIYTRRWNSDTGFTLPPHRVNDCRTVST